MSTKWQRFEIKLPKGYTKDEAKLIGEDVIRQIITRTQEDNVDKNGKAFPKYSKEYIKSVEFRAAGKSKNSVDLTLSSDMLSAIKVLQATRGKIVVGFEKGSLENSKADGNIRGTYGQSSPIRGKSRDFLGLTKDELAKILVTHESELERDVRDLARQGAEGISGNIGTSSGDGGEEEG